MLDDATAMAIIPVHDIGKARTFYEKMLGMTPAPGARSATEAIYSLGGTQLMVYETTAELGGATKAGLQVKDLAKEMDILRSHGIVFHDFDMPGLKTVNGVVEDEHGKAAWFKDLEGNWIVLSQPGS